MRPVTSGSGPGRLTASMARSAAPITPPNKEGRVPYSMVRDAPFKALEASRVCSQTQASGKSGIRLPVLP